MSTDAYDAEIACEMLRKAEMGRNAVFSRVEKGPFSRTGKWSPMDWDEAVPQFPVLSNAQHLSRGMRFPTIWYVRPAKAQTSLRMRAD